MYCADIRFHMKFLRVFLEQTQQSSAEGKNIYKLNEYIRIFLILNLTMKILFLIYASVN